MGYTLELLVSALRGLRHALGRLVGEDEGGEARRSAASGARARVPRRDRLPEEDAVRRALATAAPLPVSYGDDRLVLVARDAETLFASWDLAAAGERPAGAADARLVLRIEDLTLLDFAAARPWRHHDVEVEEPVGTRYLRLARPAGTYRAELGWRGGDGRFVPRARSATATTPREGAPGHDPLRWMTVRVDRAAFAGDAPARLDVRRAPPPPGAPVEARRAPHAVPRAPSSEEQHRRGG